MEHNSTNEVHLEQILRVPMAKNHLINSLTNKPIFYEKPSPISCYRLQ